MQQLTNKEKKEFLRRYQYLKRRELELAEEIEELRSQYTGHAIRYSDMPKAHNAEHDLSDYAAKLDKLFERLKERKTDTIRAYYEIEDAIETVEDMQERELLRLRYLRGMRWEAVAERIGYTERRMHQLHGLALEHLSINIS